MPDARASDSWREHTRQDWQRMHLHLHADDGSAAGFYLQQVIEKFLKGWLLDHGWQLRKTHNLEELLDAACAHDPALTSFRPLCQRVSSYYFADRYPGAGGTSPDTDQVRAGADEAERLVLTLFPDERLG